MQPPTSAKGLQIATWNVNFRPATVLDALADLQTVPDILTLQEVSVKHADAFRERLVEMGLPYVFYSGRADSPEKPYGNMVASYYSVESVDSENLKAALPWPQLVTHVLVEAGGKPVHIITAHVPNGAGNGWAKIDTFRAIAELVRRIKGAPCLLTGDFNEPQFALQDGRIVTFGQDEIAPGQYRCWRKWEFDGRSGTGEEWDAAVRWLFEGRAEHGLRHAY